MNPLLDTSNTRWSLKPSENIPVYDLFIKGNMKCLPRTQRGDSPRAQNVTQVPGASHRPVAGLRRRRGTLARLLLSLQATAAMGKWWRQKNTHPHAGVMPPETPNLKLKQNPLISKPASMHPLDMSDVQHAVACAMLLRAAQT